MRSDLAKVSQRLLATSNSAIGTRIPHRFLASWPPALFYHLFSKLDRMTASLNRKEATRMWKKRIQPTETVPLKLTDAERKLVLNEVLCLDQGYLDTIQSTPAGKPVMMTLTDLDDFGGYIAAEANHCENPRKEKKLDAIFEKIQKLLERYTDDGESAVEIKQAKVEIAPLVRSPRAGKPPDVVSFKLPRASKQQDERFLVPLTALQRESLVSCTQLKSAIKRRLKAAESGTQAIEFTAKELDHMENELGQAALFVRHPQKQRILAVQKKVRDILAEVRLVAFGPNQIPKRRQPTKPSELLFQFKIMLLEVTPSVWRRIQIRDCTLADLHEHIQAAFGWENYHMHQFEIDGERYGVSSADECGFDLEVRDESQVSLSQLLPKSGKRQRLIYEYDFGDGWRHEILFEGYSPVDAKVKYPLCIEGENACPPEDIGGPWGYAEFLQAIGDANDERHEEFMEWSGSFDPSAFDARQATRKMRKPIWSD